MRPPEGTEIELLRLVAANGRMSHEDALLDPYCDDASTLSEPDIFNRCHDLGWLVSSHDDRFDSSTVWITDAGCAALADAPAPDAEPEATPEQGIER